MFTAYVIFYVAADLKPGPTFILCIHSVKNSISFNFRIRIYWFEIARQNIDRSMPWTKYFVFPIHSEGFR